MVDKSNRLLLFMSQRQSCPTIVHHSCRQVLGIRRGKMMASYWRTHDLPQVPNSWLRITDHWHEGLALRLPHRGRIEHQSTGSTQPSSQGGDPVLGDAPPLHMA